jgi:hypothetical protein
MDKPYAPILEQAAKLFTDLGPERGMATMLTAFLAVAETYVEGKGGSMSNGVSFETQFCYVHIEPKGVGDGETTH